VNWYCIAKKEEPKKWISIDSSFIQLVFYSDFNKELEIKLKNGKTYSYIDVPLKTFKAFMKARSKGTFFNDIIKPKYLAKS
jgi:hypothetical protein